jgi:hypothetical protein
MEIKKITFITYHNWETKRHGGFHQFAKYTCEQGIKTVFFSFSRPYYILFKKEERLNYKIFKSLNKGCCYNVGKHNLENITWSTFALPGFLRKFVPSFVNNWLMCHSLKPFKKFADKWLKNTDCFVFESCDAVLLLPLIKKHFPQAQIIYRPSDPLIEFSNENYVIRAEKQLITVADKILLVNDESLTVYKDNFPDIYDKNKFFVVSNGVSVSEYLKKYDCPEELKDKKTALYIGAFSVDWNLIIMAALQLPNICFVIITPNIPNQEIVRQIRNISNILYIPGINPSQVPQWITNANLILQPFSDSLQHYNKKSLGLTAKNYKAIAAKKTIVTHCIPMHLSKYGLITTNSYQDFIDAVAENISKENIEYNIDINEKNWDKLCALFLKIVKNNHVE